MDSNQLMPAVSLATLFPAVLSNALPNSLPNVNTSETAAVDWQALLVTGIKEDSRAIVSGDLFVARDGDSFKGSDYIETAAKRGAVAALVNKEPHAVADLDLTRYSIPVIAIENLTYSIGAIAAQVFANLVSKLTIIGVTGTNGKTSCAHYIAQALNSLGVKTFIIGTLGNGEPSALAEASRTTPDACSLQQMFADFYQRGAQAVVMEVSSHALVQGRVQGVPFKVVAYTNLSRDHLDYHGDMQHYAAAKAQLFTDFSAEHKILNLDDRYNRQLAGELAEGSVTSYSEDHRRNADFTAQQIALDNGLSFTLKKQTAGQLMILPFKSQLLGKFNVANLLLTTAVLSKLGYSDQQVQQSISQLQPVPGRMQNVVNPKLAAQPLCIVDYAHTPDALEKALQASRIHCVGKLILVFGCGGDRDNGKRAEMAKVAECNADVVIVTSDNPRTEEPKVIIEMITRGFAAASQYQIISDRRAAIYQAISGAEAADLVLVAGKGHEDYQEIMGVKQHFSDAEVVLEGLANWPASKSSDSQSNSGASQ